MTLAEVKLRISFIYIHRDMILCCETETGCYKKVMLDKSYKVLGVKNMIEGEKFNINFVIRC